MPWSPAGTCSYTAGAWIKEMRARVRFHGDGTISMGPGMPYGGGQGGCGRVVLMLAGSFLDNFLV